MQRGRGMGVLSGLKRHLALWVVLAWALGASAVALPAPLSALSEYQQLVVDAWSLVNQSYVDPAFNGVPWKRLRQEALEQPINDRDDAYGAIAHMLAPLDDPFTRLLRPAEFQALNESTAGAISGVGLRLGVKEGETAVVVVGALKGSPAQEAGIEPGSRVLSVAGKDVDDLGLEGVAAALRGPAETRVTLVLELPEGDQETHVLERRMVDLRPVRSRRLRKNGHTYGLLQLSQFSENVPEQVVMALDDLEEKEIEGLVLDLRNNSGGLVGSGIAVGDVLLDELPLVQTVDRNGIGETINTSAGSLYSGPMVVLVNSGTASASEILAGALQDHHRATLIGRPTFGKAVIQTLLPLGDGSGLAVSVAHYLTPRGHDIDKEGLMPDLVLAAPDQLAPDSMDTDPWLNMAMSSLQHQLQGGSKGIERSATT